MSLFPKFLHEIHTHNIHSDPQLNRPASGISLTRQSNCILSCRWTGTSLRETFEVVLFIQDPYEEDTVSDDPNLGYGRWFISDLGLEEGFTGLAVGEGDD